MTIFGKIILGAWLISPFIGHTQDEEFIEWSPAKRLSWEDYLAKPASSSDAAAITSTALGLEYHVRNNVLTYKITCRFSKTRSWGKYKTDYILLHEQGHFDITEIYARKLDEAIRDYNFNPKKFKTDLDQIYKDIMEEKEDVQNQYDLETDFSRNQEKQADWIKKIQKELMRYSAT
jgi:predicted secreted Zn-dependent protease